MLIQADANAPDPFAGKIDLDVYLGFDFTAVPVDTLAMSISSVIYFRHLPVGLSLLETVGDIVVGSGALLIGPYGVIALVQGISVGEAMLEASGPPSFPTEAIPAFNCTAAAPKVEGGGRLVSQEVKCQKVGGKTFALGPERSVGLLVDEVRGLPDNMVTGGTIRLPGRLGSEFTVELSGFSWQEPSLSCGAAGDAAAIFAGLLDPGLLVHAQALITVRPKTGSRVYVHAASVRSADPNGVVDGVRIQGWPNATTCVLSVHYNQRYFDDAYSFFVLLHTTGGIRLIEVPPPPFRTAEDIERSAFRGIGRSVSDCYSNIDPFFKGFKGEFNPRWSPDPPFDPREDIDGRLMFLWQVSVRGLASGEAVEVRQLDERSLGTIHSSVSVQPNHLSRRVDGHAVFVFFRRHLEWRSGVGRHFGGNIWTRGIAVI